MSKTRPDFRWYAAGKSFRALCEDAGAGEVPGSAAVTVRGRKVYASWDLVNGDLVVCVPRASDFVPPDCRELSLDDVNVLSAG